jgi:hypothetical protein
MLWPFYLQGKRSQYPVSRRLGGHRAGLDILDKRKILVPAGNHIPVIQAVARYHID